MTCQREQESRNFFRAPNKFHCHVTLPLSPRYRHRRCLPSHLKYIFSLAVLYQISAYNRKPQQKRKKTVTFVLLRTWHATLHLERPLTVSGNTLCCDYNCFRMQWMHYGRSILRCSSHFINVYLAPDGGDLITYAYTKLLNLIVHKSVAILFNCSRGEG